MRLFLDKAFRKEVIDRVTDEQVRQFWTREFPSMNYKTAFDGVAPIANKLGAFLANPVVRRALTEPEEPLRFRKIMDEGQIQPDILDALLGNVGTVMSFRVSPNDATTIARHLDGPKVRDLIALPN